MMTGVAVVPLTILSQNGAIRAMAEGSVILPFGSQMPRHPISDAHEWINEIPTVPIYFLVKPQPRERAWGRKRGKKTLLSLTVT